MASYRSSSTVNGSGTNIVVPAPAGIADGDDLRVGIGHGNAAVTVVPGGWTLDYNGTGIAGTQRLDVYRKIASGEPASWQWTLGSAVSFVAHCQATQDVDGTSPTGSGQINGSSVSITAPAQNPSVGGCILCGFFYLGIGGPTITPAAGMTEVQEATNGSNVLELAWELLASSGSTGTRVATSSGAGGNAGYLVAIVPSGAVTNASMLFQFANLG